MKVGLFVKKFSRFLVLSIVIMPVTEVRAAGPSTGEKVAEDVVVTAVTVFVGLPLVIIIGGCKAAILTFNPDLCTGAFNLVFKAFSALVPNGSSNTTAYDQIQPKLPDIIQAVMRGTGQVSTPAQEQAILDKFNAAYAKAKLELPASSSDVVVLRSTLVNVALENGYTPDTFSALVDRVIVSNSSMSQLDVTSLRVAAGSFNVKYNAQNGSSTAAPLTGTNNDPDQSGASPQADLEAIAAAKQTALNNLAEGAITQSGLNTQIAKLQRQAAALRQQAEETEDVEQKDQLEQQAQDLDDQAEGYQQAIDEE